MPDGVPDDLRFYDPAPRGLEIRIGEKLEELRQKNEQSRKKR